MNHPIALPALSVGEQPLYLGGRQLSLTPAVRLQPYTWPGLKNGPEQGATPRTCTFSPVAAGCCTLLALCTPVRSSGNVSWISRPRPTLSGCGAWRRCGERACALLPNAARTSYPGGATCGETCFRSWPKKLAGAGGTERRATGGAPPALSSSEALPYLTGNEKSGRKTPAFQQTSGERLRPWLARCPRRSRPH